MDILAFPGGGVRKYMYIRTNVHARTVYIRIHIFIHSCICTHSYIYTYVYMHMVYIYLHGGRPWPRHIYNRSVIPSRLQYLVPELQAVMGLL